MLCTQCDLDQIKVGEVRAGVESCVCGAGLRSQHASARQRHRPHELCKKRKTEEERNGAQYSLDVKAHFTTHQMLGIVNVIKIINILGSLLALA